jgi:tetratricopeptide (TPR) repeat protein
MRMARRCPDDCHTRRTPVTRHTRVIHHTPPKTYPPQALARAPWRAAVLEALLAAHKAGALDELLTQRPKTTQALGRRWLAVVKGTAGDALHLPTHSTAAVVLLLRWALAQMRPDQGSAFKDITRQAWLDMTSWRPLLALLCHFGFEPVPVFRDRHHPAAGEAPADSLCALWSVGPSSYYRYLDKGKRLLAQVLTTPPSGLRAASLRQAVEVAVRQRMAFADEPERCAWHTQQAQLLLAASSPVDTISALWHLQQAGDASAFTRLLQNAAVAAANSGETDGLCQELGASPTLMPRQRFELCVAQATLWRIRQTPERENRALDQALAEASRTNEPLLLGLAYAALGKFFEARDSDRAYACYEDSADFLRRARAAPGDSAAAEEIASAYVTTLVYLAWLYVLRNDPRARTVLDRAEELRADSNITPQVQAALEQTWGEYWRRAGDLRRALEHKHRALNLFERIGDRRSVLVTYLNLPLLYGKLKEFDRAIDYAQRVIRASEQASLEPEMLCSVHLNLGVTYFWQGHNDAAITQYQIALQHGRAAGLVLHMRRAHFNLAEAFYKRFLSTRDLQDEQAGDAHAAAAAQGETHADQARAAQQLKEQVLGDGAEAMRQNLLPQEFAAHFDEMAEVQRQRAVLAVPIDPQAHARAHLAIARAYLAVAAKEREAALALMHKHQLAEPFTAELAALASTFNRTLTRQEHIAAQWKAQAADLLHDERRALVLAELFEAGSLSKSAYAQRCGVALATASKHLTRLAQRGLLHQTGKGPSTRYVLPP